MENTQTQKSFKDYFSDPSDLMNRLNNPGKFGMELYNSLSVRNKQYITFAAGIGLIVYAISLGKQK